ncbi:MAG: hydrogenase small subunit [Phycisphaerae bacterium]
MELNRRDFLKASSAVAGAIGLGASGLWKLQSALGAVGSSPPVIWLQGQNCTGCSVSLLNSIYYTTIDNLLTNVIDLEYHSTVMAAAGDLAVSAATANLTKPHILIVEGAIPTAGGGKFCEIWPGMTILDAVRQFADQAAYIVAMGTCAAYGGMAAGNPNPTGAMGLSKVLPGKTVVNIPGCPAQPDWLVGTVAYILKNGKAPTLDANGRPTDFYGTLCHDRCPRLEAYREGEFATRLGDREECLDHIGCRGWKTYCDCPTRKWNGAAAGVPGINWCIGANNPCIGCTQPDFPDGASPFYMLDPGQYTSATAPSGGGGGGTGGGGGNTGATPTPTPNPTPTPGGGGNTGATPTPTPTPGPTPRPRPGGDHESDDDSRTGATTTPQPTPRPTPRPGGDGGGEIDDDVIRATPRPTRSPNRERERESVRSGGRDD